MTRPAERRRRARALEALATRALVALAALALWAGPLHAQAPAQQPGAAAEAAKPAPPAAPEAVPVGEISNRAQVVADEVRATEASLASKNDHAQLESDLVRYAERIEPELPVVASELLQAPSLAVLTQLRVEWQAFERQLVARQERLQKLIASREQERDRLLASRAVWRETRTKAQERDVPPATLDAIKAALDDIKRGSGALEGALNDALVLQSQYADLYGSVQQTLASIEEARERVLDNLLVRDVPPLWDLDLTGLPDNWKEWRAGAYLQELKSDTVRYLAQQQDAVAVHVLLFGVLIWALRRARAALWVAAPKSAEDPDEGTEAPPEPVDAARLATQHPLAAATILALLAVPLLHDDMPRTMFSALRLIFVLPTVIVLRPLLGQAFRAPLYLLTVFFVIDRLRDIMTGVLVPYRLVFAVEMTALCIVLLLLLRPGRLELLPASARGNRWLSALGLWIRISAVAAGAAALASAAGYTRFANLLGGGVLGSGYAVLVLFALVRIAEGLAAAIFGGRLLSSVRMVERHRALLLERTRKLFRAVGALVWVSFVLELFALRAPIVRGTRALLGTTLGYGSFNFSIGGVVAFGVTLAGAWLFSRAVLFVLDEEVFPRVSLARGVPFALSTLVRYAILLLGFLVALSALGFDLDRITILLGAFGVGIGFGLQNVVNNFVSGIILLFERPVKVGDQVELTGLAGTVQRIGIRASTVRTGDGADVIVPNAALITEQVVNWTLSDRLRRLVLPVGVAYGTDPHKVIELLRGVAERHPGVCKFPKPMVVFAGFGESALNFEMRVWTDDPDTFIDVRSEVGLATHDALRDARIDVPFPQRTLHVGSIAPSALEALRGKPDGLAPPES